VFCSSESSHSSRGPLRRFSDAALRAGVVAATHAIVAFAVVWKVWLMETRGKERHVPLKRQKKHVLQNCHGEGSTIDKEPHTTYIYTIIQGVPFFFVSVFYFCCRFYTAALHTL